MGYHKGTQCIYYRNPRRKREGEGTENIFKAIMAESLTSWRENGYPDPQGSKDPK